VTASPHRLTIARVDRDPADALVLTFDVPAAARTAFAFKPGQHVVLRAEIDGEDVRRNYSICAGPDEPLRVAIKRAPEGRFSTWAHASLSAGDAIDVFPPSGRFVLPPSEARTRRIVLFAVGSGITPCLGIIRQALNGETGTHVTLVYGNRRRETVMFADELDMLKDVHLGRFDMVSLFTAEGEADVPLFEGRIDADKVRALAERLIDVGTADRVFVCAPVALTKTIRDSFVGLGVAKDRIVHEFFAPPDARRVASPPSPTAAAAPTAMLIVTLDGVRHRVPVAAGQSILDAALAAGVKPPSACRGGMCCTCRAKLVAGVAPMTLNYSLEPWEIERGFVLTCQAVPASDTIHVDYDAL
jgi:ring-1,2-phenylacetyl-CoA epoxidase subunit PaaE